MKECYWEREVAGVPDGSDNCSRIPREMTQMSDPEHEIIERSHIGRIWS
jgi:hypothetical protein